MTGIDGVALQKVIIHKIGNPSRGEELQLSDKLLTIDDEIVTRLLTSYFLKPFNENELYQFTHLSDLSLNEVYTYISRLFENPESFVEQSALLAQFLYSKSTHSKVKEGELYVALFDEVPFEKETMQAIGIFKSETKETFLKLFPREKDWELTQEEGININKLDKGCLVFKTDTAEGFKVCVVDNTNKQQDAQYWVTDFLQVSPVSDSYHHTDKYLSLCKSFVTNEYAEKFEVSKSDQLELLNRSMDYFKTKEQFNLQEFTEEVIHHPEVVNTFMDYKRNFEASRQFEIEDEFDIHLAAVKKQQRVFKSVLKLDKNFHIYIHGRRDLIEKGVDEMTGKKYYKIYYEEES
ncbi:nucleoid-associated protein [Terrimonas alba]|uniref:nucleoid-associated protein n=1 Tax=Terrimonas alba TaxID=3349636 RepID=UPI0035F4C596